MDILQIIRSDVGYIGDDLKVKSEWRRDAKRLCWEYNQTSPENRTRRKEILQQLFGDCSEQTIVEPDFRCEFGFNIHTNGLTLINYNCVILDNSPVYIGKNVFIAPGVCITCVGHPIDAAQRAEGLCASFPITIGDDVWIGANAVVCGGVTIGKGSVIGAGSVVTKDIPADVLAAGTPCRVIRVITEADKIPPERITF